MKGILDKDAFFYTQFDMGGGILFVENVTKG